MVTAEVREDDPRTLRHWAAEDVAISLGLLRECPYHGQPFRAGSRKLAAHRLATTFASLLDPAMKVFNGNTQELLAAVERVTRDSDERCRYCAASDQDDFD